MKTEEADEIIKNIKEKLLFNDDDISSYLQSTGKVNSKDDMIQILSSMVRNQNIYPNFFVCKQILNCATKSDDYANLISAMTATTKFSLDLSDLVNLHSIESDIADYVYHKLSNMKEESNSIAMGYILGGLGQQDPEQLFKIVKNNVDSTVKEKIAYTLALQLTSEKHKIPDEFIDFIISNADSENWRLKQTIINVMADVFGSEKKIEEKLMALAKKDDDTRRMIAYIVGPLIKRKELAMKLLEECSKTNNSQVMDEVAQQLGMLAPHFPIQCLTIAKRWMGNTNSELRPYSSWYVTQIGKGDLERVKKFLMEWIETEKDINVIRFHLPNVIAQIYTENEVKLMELIEVVDYKNEEKSALIVNTLETFLYNGYGEVRRTEDFLQKCFNILLKIAANEKIDTNIDPAINSLYMKVMAIIKAIKTREIKVNSEYLKKFLDDFPNLVSFLTRRELEDLIDKKSYHPLVRQLSYACTRKSEIQKMLGPAKEYEWKNPKAVNFLPSQFYPLAFLFCIDSALSMFGLHDTGMPRIKDGLLDENGYFQTVTELKIAATLKKKHIVLLQPPVGNNKLDIKVGIDNKDHLFEIYSPKEDIRLKYVPIAHGIKNKAKPVVLSKIETQMRAAESQHLPVILVIDNSRAPEVGETEIIDMIFGTYQWNVVLDKKTGKFRGHYPSRTKDSISEMSPYGKVVSAVVLVNRDIDYNDYKIKMYGKIFLNPEATIQLDERTIQTLKESLFGNSIV